jgi:hypothetical protein
MLTEKNEKLHQSVANSYLANDGRNQLGFVVLRVFATHFDAIGEYAVSNTT